jgi:nucleoside-diphosphate-sugar epimerase
MHVLVTGASGLIGSNIMVTLLQQKHRVTATDINPLPPVVLDQLRDFQGGYTFHAGDLTKIDFVDSLFDDAIPYDGIMHIGGIRSPAGLDARIVHNINTVASYNVLETAARRGVRRMVQASSCNALGLSWTMPEHWKLDYVPLNEKHPMRPVSDEMTELIGPGRSL